jgi:hypothetical protein
MFEVLYRDGGGAWRRWALLASREAAARSQERCERFMRGCTEVRVAELRVRPEPPEVRDFGGAFDGFTVTSDADPGL